MPKRQETVKIESLDRLQRTPLLDAVCNDVQPQRLERPGGEVQEGKVTEARLQ